MSLPKPLPLALHYMLDLRISFIVSFVLIGMDTAHCLQGYRRLLERIVLLREEQDYYQRKYMGEGQGMSDWDTGWA